MEIITTLLILHFKYYHKTFTRIILVIIIIKKMEHRKIQIELWMIAISILSKKKFNLQQIQFHKLIVSQLYIDNIYIKIL